MFVDRGLAEFFAIYGPLTKSHQGRAAGVLHTPQICCIDLRVTIKAAKGLINNSRVQKDGEATGESFGQAPPALMKYVQVVLETQQFGFGKTVWLHYAGYNPALLFFEEKRRTTQYQPFGYSHLSVSALCTIAFGFFKSGFGQWVMYPLK